jgi:pimeloyl-ACP methyl ester carboxylesterase
MKTVALLAAILWSSALPAQASVTGYAPVNGLRMYYEIHGTGQPVVLLHGAFMTISSNWPELIARLSPARQVIAVELQGHGRTGDIERDLSYENLADDVAGLLDYLKIPKADLIGYSLGGGVAMETAIRHPDKVGKVVVISAALRSDGLVREAHEAFAHMTPDAFKGSPLEAEYRKVSPTPDAFPKFAAHVIAMAQRRYDFGADRLAATRSPMFFIDGDADGIRLDHIAEMFRLKGGDIHGDLQPRSASRLAIVPNTTHVGLIQRMTVIGPMISDFLDDNPTPR